MAFTMLFDTTFPGRLAGMFILTIAALIILLLLIILAEAVVLQLIRWGNFRSSYRASIIINVVSSTVGVLLMLAFPRPGVPQLLIAWVITVLIEGPLLMLLKRGATKENWFAAVVVNLASYLVLIGPAYLFRG